MEFLLVAGIFFLVIFRKAKKQKTSISQVYFNIHLAWRIFIGIMLGWLLCADIIVILFGGDSDSFIEGVGPFIFFIAFPMGVILGGGLTLVFHKHHKEQTNLTESTPKIPNDSETKIQQITKLKELLDANAITEEEYNTEKNKILNS